MRIRGNKRKVEIFWLQFHMIVTLVYYNVQISTILEEPEKSWNEKLLSEGKFLESFTSLLLMCVESSNFVCKISLGLKYELQSLVENMLKMTDEPRLEECLSPIIDSDLMIICRLLWSLAVNCTLKSNQSDGGFLASLMGTMLVKILKVH